MVLGEVAAVALGRRVAVTRRREPLQVAALEQLAGLDLAVFPRQRDALRTESPAG